MHLPTHILSGWCVANVVPRFGARERLLAMIAASIADIDGLGIVVSEQAFWALHHKLGHNVFFGILVSLGLAAFATRGRRWPALVVCLACFHLHLLMDYFGSGPGWSIEYVWPISSYGWKTDLAWPLTSWQNRVAFGVLLAITVLIAWRWKRTPIELLAPRLDRIITAHNA